MLKLVYGGLPLGGSQCQSERAFAELFEVVGHDAATFHEEMEGVHAERAGCRSIAFQ
jgi:hypothetical protein